jgi:hypothetical protein
VKREKGCGVLILPGAIIPLFPFFPFFPFPLFPFSPFPLFPRLLLPPPLVIGLTQPVSSSGIKEIATHLSYFNFCRNKDNPANMMNLGISAYHNIGIFAD